MASVSSLDQDMRNLRMSRYTPQAANEVRTWIETTLGESLPPGDLLDALKDGVALCKLANLVLPPPGIRFKSSAMPFMQMENISHFLKACEMPPLNMPAHDRFLTVDLYESKDPAQVLQCLGAFSRQAHSLQPSRFTTTIGPRKQGLLSPTLTGGFSNGFSSNRPPSPVKSSTSTPAAARALSPTLTGGSNGSQANVSSWSRKTDEGVTTPAWNIAQYGYMGGASQGNQGISFGARRQITTQAPHVPSLAEKERLRREKAAEEERVRQQMEEAEHKRQTERDAEEGRERAQEERRWAEETQRLREDERQRVDEQKRKWAEEERRWKQEDEARRKEEAEIKAALTPGQTSGTHNQILKGQSLSEYQREQAASADQADGQGEPKETPEQKRVRELEKQLEEARERERQYQAERDGRPKPELPAAPAKADRPGSSRESEASWAPDEREFLRQQWQSSRENTPSKLATQVSAARPLPLEPKPASPFARPLPQPNSPPPLPTRAQAAQPEAILAATLDEPVNERPLPVPTSTSDAHLPEQARPNRTEHFLSSNPPPQEVRATVSSSRETGDSSLEQQQDRDKRLASQQKTKAGGWASKSLLEREMERERERQREWEANQKAIKDVPRDQNEGSGPGQSWSTAQYGYLGGDNQGRGSSSGSGIDFGGRRQIVQPQSKPGGPRPLK